MAFLNFLPVMAVVAFITKGNLDHIFEV